MERQKDLVDPNPLSPTLERRRRVEYKRSGIAL